MDDVGGGADVVVDTTATVVEVEGVDVAVVDVVGDAWACAGAGMRAPRTVEARTRTAATTVRATAPVGERRACGWLTTVLLPPGGL